MIKKASLEEKQQYQSKIPIRLFATQAGHIFINARDLSMYGPVDALATKSPSLSPNQSATDFEQKLTLNYLARAQTALSKNQNKTLNYNKIER